MKNRLHKFIIVIIVLAISVAGVVYIFRGRGEPMLFPSISHVNSPESLHISPTPEKSAFSPVPRPTGAWVKPPEKHYDEKNIVAVSRKKYVEPKLKNISGKWDLAKEEEAIREALSEHPGEKGILYLLAYNQFDRESYDEAIGIFDRILTLFPGEEQAIEGRIYAVFKKEEYETSREMAEEALGKFPDNPRLHHILAGSYLFGFKKPDKAIELYERAIRLDPGDVRIWLGYGESFFEMKDDKSRRKGIEILTECIKRFPDYHIAYIVLAEEYQYMGDYKQAVELLEKSIRLDPSYYRAYSIIGDMLVSRQRYDEAMEYYQRTIKTNPVYEAVVFNKVGDLYGILGDDRNAEKYYLTALDVHKGNDEQNQEKAAAYLGLSRLASQKGDYKQAEKFIKQAFDSFPRYEYNHYYQALLYLDMKEYDKAEKALSYCHSPQTEESMDQYEIDYGKAQIASVRGDQKTAFTFLEKAVNQANDYAKADIMAKAERDRYLKDLRRTAGYAGLKDRVGETEKILPPMKLDKSLLKLWK